MLARVLRKLAEKRRIARINREFDRDIAAIRTVRRARSEAAIRGQSTEIKRRAEACRRQFNI